MPCFYLTLIQLYSKPVPKERDFSTWAALGRFYRYICPLGLAHLRGNGSDRAISNFCLVECYDAGAFKSPKLANINAGAVDRAFFASCLRLA